MPLSLQVSAALDVAAPLKREFDGGLRSEEREVSAAFYGYGNAGIRHSLILSTLHPGILLKAPLERNKAVLRAPGHMSTELWDC